MPWCPETRSPFFTRLPSGNREPPPNQLLCVPFVPDDDVIETLLPRRSISFDLTPYAQLRIRGETGEARPPSE